MVPGCRPRAFSEISPVREQRCQVVVDRLRVALDGLARWQNTLLFEALCGIKTAVSTLKWGGRDSNPRPEDYESPALTG